MKRIALVVLATGVILSACSAVPAQEKEPFSIRYRLKPMTILFYLRQKTVQEDLKLSQEKAKKPQELYEKYGAAVRQSLKLSREERQTKIQEELKAMERALAEILNAEQTQRLVQIFLQVNGGSSLSIPEVAKELHLTDEQKVKVKAIRAEDRRAQSKSLAALRDRLTGGKPGPLDADLRKRYFEEGSKMQAKERKATTEKLLSVLTAEQKAKWKAMIGEPFKGEWPSLRTPLQVPNREEP